MPVTFLTDEDEKRYVRSVNGKKPDANGNVAIETGSGGGATPDWNAAEGEAGHILNRPFYKAAGATKILDGYQPVYDENEGSFMFAEPFSLEDGGAYTITWNGVDYNCTAAAVVVFDGTSTVGVGNFGAAGLPGFEDTGEPFVLLVLPSEMAAETGAYGMGMDMTGATEVTVSISSGLVVPIPVEYLPAGYPYIVPGGEEILPEMAFESGQTVLPMGKVSVGAPYKVVVDGTAYSSKAAIASIEGTPLMAIGNLSMLSQGADTGEPFLMTYANGSWIMTFYKNGESGTVSVTSETWYVPMDVRYLSELPDIGASNLDNGKGDGSVRAVNTAEEDDTYSVGDYSAAFGKNTKASGPTSFAVGGNTEASGHASFAAGSGTIASGAWAHAVGGDTTASGDWSHAEGQNTKASGYWSHAEGAGTVASSYYDHAEGSGTEASGGGSHAEGRDTVASGGYSHAEGIDTVASDIASHAEGSGTVASAYYTHAEGNGTVAASRCSHVQGKYNIADTDEKYAHIVGNGKNSDNRSNAHTIDWECNAWYQGDVYVGSTSGTNRDGGSKKLATEEFVTNSIAGIQNDIVQQVLDQLGTGVIGEVDADNNILITSTLPNGTYTMRYENADGSTTVIGTFTVSGGSDPVPDPEPDPEPTIVNLADPTSADWLTNKRIKGSTKEIVDVTESERGDKTLVITNMIPITGVTKLHVKGLDIMSNLTASSNNYGRYYVYNASGELVQWQLQPSHADFVQYFTTADYDSSVTVIDVTGLVTKVGYANQTHIRLGGILTGTAEDVIITADQNIV